MTRRYYKDPLAIAWMAKHFGMRFERQDGDLLLDWDDVAEDLAMNISSDTWAGKYFIHPDSLHLLDSQDGDLAALITNGRPLQVDSPELADFVNKSSSWKIIHRNGIPFMWPEGEAA